MKLSSPSFGNSAATPRFGDLVVKFDDTKHPDFQSRRSVMQAALKEAGVDAMVTDAKSYHGHGKFDLVHIATQFNKLAKEALKPLKKTGLISELFIGK